MNFLIFYLLYIIFIFKFINWEIENSGYVYISCSYLTPSKIILLYSVNHFKFYNDFHENQLYIAFIFIKNVLPLMWA